MSGEVREMAQALTQIDPIVDRVAAAIYAEAQKHRIAPAVPDLPEPPAWSAMNRRAKKYWRNLAVAAVAALMDDDHAR